MENERLDLECSYFIERLFCPLLGVLCPFVELQDSLL